MSKFDDDFIRGSCLPVIASQRVRATTMSRYSLQNKSFLAVGDAHAGARIALDTIGRDRITQAVFRKLLHALDRFGKMRRLERHQHFLVGNAAITPLGKTRQGKTGLAGL